MANKRIFYACYQAGLAPNGSNTFTSIHGLQSCGINTTFNLEQIFEIGQISIYDNLENIPDIEVTLEKCLDGYCPIYLLATYGAASPSLSGRSNTKTTLGLSIYSDVQDSASGTPFAQCTCSGLFVSQLNYAFNTQGASTEQVTMVGNNKIWTNSFTPTAFNNQDSPLAITGSGGVQRRQDILFGATDTTVKSACLLPTDIPGITASGTNEQAAGGDFGAHIESIKVSANLGREALYELGRRGVYHRYVQFPVEVKSDFEVLDIQGDHVAADENALNNTTNQRIFILMREGLHLDLGTKNRMASVTWGGANAGRNGGNATATFSYITFNDLTVQHPQDPTTALRP